MKDQSASASPTGQSAQVDIGKKLKEARKTGNSDLITEVLVEHASKLVQEGKFGFALAEMDEAIELNRSNGKVYEQARLIQLSATLFRAQGNFIESNKRAVDAMNLAEQIGDPEKMNPIIVAAAAELGETALAQGNGDSAALAFGKAYEIGHQAGLIETYQSSLLRKRAAAYALAGKFDTAANDLEQAYTILIRNGEQRQAVQTRLELLGALIQSNPQNIQQIEQLFTETHHQADRLNDHAAIADLYLLQATLALMQDKPEAALAAANTARREALAGRAPLSYISAISTVSQLEERSGNRMNAYGALASGWATIGDLLGPQAARATFEPLLNNMRDRWGNQDFWHAKAEYENMRRKIIDQEKSAQKYTGNSAAEEGDY